jgi:hypothetical protein
MILSAPGHGIARSRDSNPAALTGMGIRATVLLVVRDHEGQVTSYAVTVVTPWIEQGTCRFSVGRSYLLSYMTMEEPGD